MVVILNADDASIKHRVVTISGNISTKRAAEWISILEGIRSLDERRPVSIYIDSPGGDADAALALVDQIQCLNTEYGIPTVGIVHGRAHSAAVLILLACQHREAFENSTFLVHHMRAFVSSSFVPIDCIIESIIKTASLCVRFVIERTSLTMEEYMNYADSEREFGSSEALRLGFIHRIS